jgi:hypothetical protein
MTINFKSFQNSGQIQDVKGVENVEKLHRLTTDVIIYAHNHYIEMLSDGKFLYRPSGKGQGKRSKVLVNVEKYIYKFGDTANQPPKIFSKLSAKEGILARIDDKLSRIKTVGINDKTEECSARKKKCLQRHNKKVRRNLEKK